MILGRYGISNLGVASLNLEWGCHHVRWADETLWHEQIPSSERVRSFYQGDLSKAFNGGDKHGVNAICIEFLDLFLRHVTGLHGWRNGGRERVREGEGLWGTGVGAILARKLQITNHAEYKSVKLASD